ncbi:FHA domain-containing protein PS1-like [Primulina huaijiensis]|uniref:FHA domain-containing protein PS1-like n=1 Tax=Primulina huaijiensis TaxID=1492673 RepID=UPI003CC74945
MGDTQEQLESNEREIPVFTVLKNNCILKNIYLLDNPPSLSPYSSLTAKNGDQDSEIEEMLVVGRHPDCSIKLEHPSISRFHLRITLKPSSRSLFVTDLSSVHGTWVSGERIEAGVLMKMNEGDTLQLGGSSRLYKLNWIPLSRAYDIDNPFVPQSDIADTVDADAKGETFQDETCMSDQAQILSDSMKGLELLHSDENPAFSTEKMSPSGSLMPENSCYSFFNNTKMETKEIHIQENKISSIQPCEFDKEHDTSGALCPSVVSQTQSEMKNTKTPGMKSDKRSGLSIWSRRGKPESVQIETGRHVEKSSAGTSNSSHVKSLVDENCHTESILKDTLASPDHEEEEIFTPDKGNHSPFFLVVGSWMSKAEKNHESILKTPTPSNSSRVKSSAYENYHAESVSKDDFTGTDHEEGEIFTPDKENHSPLCLLVGSWMSNGERNRGSILKTPMSSVDHDKDIFSPDKENMSPNSRCLRSTKKMEILEVVKHPTSSHRSSPLSKSVNCNLYQEVYNLSTSDIESQSDKVLPAQKLESFAFKSHANLKKKLSILKSRGDKNSFQPLSLKSSCDGSGNSKPSTHEATMRGGRCTNYPKSEEAFLLPKKSMTEERKRWTIIVDTASLLNKNSRKELQLLRGLKGTCLIIPRIVLRELDCLLRCGGFFRRTGKVSAALQWIEDCMENTKWWIHVQSSAEEGMLIPPTPPHASSPHWYNEFTNTASVGSISFSPYGLHEIVTPTTEDHILESALFFKRIKNNEEFVLLSDDVTLKIKAMAEGLICETAEEFRRSLANPFSERFLYTQSSPRGPTWSIVDDSILKEIYYPSPSKKLSKSGGECVKGLKLILLHNSNFSKNVTEL